MPAPVATRCAFLPCGGPMLQAALGRHKVYCSAACKALAWYCNNRAGRNHTHYGQWFEGQHFVVCIGCGRTKDFMIQG